MWNRTGRDPVEAQAQELAAECEALVTGGYADFLRARGRWAPPWAWLNLLAHADREQLAAAATAAGGGPRPGDVLDSGEWRAALAFLAGEVLAQVDARGVPLTELQRSTLIPLELELMRGADPAALRPGPLAAMVEAALHHSSRP